MSEQVEAHEEQSEFRNAQHAASQHSNLEREVFLSAMELESPDERQRYLDQACAQQPALRKRVESLLAQSVLPDFLEGSPPGLSLTLAALDTDDQFELGPHFDFLSPSSKPGCIGSLGQYEIVNVIGRGAFGIVFRAYDTKLNRVVAIKAMAPELASNKMAVQRFSREAQAAAAVTHDHVITLHAIEENSNPPFIVMEFIEGESLAERIDRDGALAPVEIIRIGMQIAAGLRAAHELGMVHRDIKPANILLENGIRRVKITDFGLARAVDDIGMTQTGTIAGTPQYMSPEQGLGQPIDARSDLFSLGSVLYTLCTGRAPFRADSTVATLKRVCDDDPRDIREVNDEIPDWLAKIVMKLLEKDPGKRFQSAAEVEEVLRSYLAAMQSGRGRNWVPPAEYLLVSGSKSKSPLQIRAGKFLVPSIAFQILAIIGSFIAAWIEIESILFTGTVFGVGMGLLIAVLAINTRANWRYFAFGMSSVLMAMLVTFLINWFRWSPADEEPILGLMFVYSLIAVPWGIAILRRTDFIHAKSWEMWDELFDRPIAFLSLLSVQTLGIALSAALLPIEDESIFVTLPLFFLVLGLITSKKVLLMPSHMLTKVFAISSPIAALLLIFSVISYSSMTPGTGIPTFGEFAIYSLVTAFAFAAVPLGLWCIGHESQLLPMQKLSTFSIQTGLLSTAILAAAFAFARPALSFGPLAFMTSSLLGLALFSIAAFFAYWFYRQHEEAIQMKWFVTAIATALVAITYMGAVSIIDREKNYYFLLLDLQDVSVPQSDLPISLLITDNSTGEVRKVHASRHHESLGKYHIGNLKIELAANLPEVKIAQPNLNFSRANRYVKLEYVNPESQNSSAMIAVPSGTSAEITGEPNLFN